MSNETLAALKAKLTKTKSAIRLVNGKLTEVQTPKWGTEFATAAANDDWQRVIEYAELTGWKGIAEQVRSGLTLA